MSKIIDALRREHRGVGNVLDVLDSEIAYAPTDDEVLKRQ